METCFHCRNQPAHARLKMYRTYTAGWCRCCSFVSMSVRMHAAGDVYTGSPEDARSVQAVFYHKASRTLLVTDAAVYISSDPPEVLCPSRDISHHCCMSCCRKAVPSPARLMPTIHAHGSVAKICEQEDSDQGHGMPLGVMVLRHLKLELG